jgi:hypothetical protein
VGDELQPAFNFGSSVRAVDLDVGDQLTVGDQLCAWNHGLLTLNRLCLDACGGEGQNGLFLLKESRGSHVTSLPSSI